MTDSSKYRALFGLDDTGGLTVLVCGGRNFHDIAYLDDMLKSLKKDFGIDRIVHGGAPGADRLAAIWAMRNGIDETVYPADWAQHGKAAGPIRNAKMIAESQPNLVLALPGGRGTEDMKRRARLAGVPLISVEYNGPTGYAQNLEMMK
jgi:hypothetical protein